MFAEYSYIYYITIALQAICVIHCIRKGNQNKWIWLIVFIPLVGSIAYIFTEMFSRGQMQQVQSGMGAVLNPGGKIKKLEDQLRFSDTFNNEVVLADAYLAAGYTDKAIALYESCLTGNFESNEYVIAQLITAYFEKERYTELIPLAKKIYTLPQFTRSRTHLLYAMALASTGNIELAEKEFKTMKGKFSNYEARYQYGRFLAGTERKEEARQIFSEIVEESSHLNSRERRNTGQWFSLAKEELRKMKN